MVEASFTVPVVMIIFNRPETTARVFQVIRRIRPKQLLIVADGPRPDRPDDTMKCAAARKIVTRIDWDTELQTEFAAENLGCGPRLATGITWVFEQVEEAIILEDDCLPDPSFFPFCAELLARYRNDERIMHIAGSNFQFGRGSAQFSYYYSRFAHVWGWATWRRAWQHFDYDMTLWPDVRASDLLPNWLNNRDVVRKWRKSFDWFYGPGKRTTWDYQWQLACWLQHGLSIVPSKNLVANIGFGVEATHTDQVSPFSAMPVQSMSFPLYHPPYMIRLRDADDLTEKTLYGAGLVKRINIKLRQALDMLRLRH